MIALKKGLVAQLCPTFCNPMDYSLLVSSVNGILQEEYWSGLPFPSPGYLPNPGIEPGCPALQEDPLWSEPPGKSASTEAQSIKEKLTNTFSVLKLLVFKKLGE